MPQLSDLLGYFLSMKINLNSMMTHSALVLFITMAIASCSSEEPKPQLSDKQIKKILMKMNKADVDLENRDIQLYMEEKGLDMEMSGTGLRYNIYERGEGDSISMGSKVAFNFEIYLKDSTLCYTSEKQGPRSIVVGESSIESGFHEALDMMASGDKAQLIIPSYLAHGLSGDGDKIPSKAWIQCNIEVLRVE